MGTASTSPTAMSELVRRTPFTTGCSRWVATPGSTAWTSSGSTWSRPSISAQARAHAVSASAARGDRPVTNSGERRVCSTIAWM